VSGINLITLFWTDGGAKLPVDCRVSNNPVDGIDKNQHFRAMLIDGPGKHCIMVL
jgi:hypothetical protein